MNNLTTRWIRFYCVFCMAAIAGVLAPMAAQAKASPALDRLDSCNWNRPGVNPFMGDVIAAVDRYTDIPADVRARLKQRMRDRQYDDSVTINRDSITGKGVYDARITDMHFGAGRVCHTVSRSAWTAHTQERGLVYCEGDHCVLVPTVCRNVSRITRTSAGGGNVARASGGGAAPGMRPQPDADSFEHMAQPGYADYSPLASPSWIGGGRGGNSPGMSGGPVFASNPADFGGGNGSEELVPPPIPEPETWAMMLAGFAVLGFAARRRARRPGA